MYPLLVGLAGFWAAGDKPVTDAGRQAPAAQTRMGRPAPAPDQLSFRLRRVWELVWRVNLQDDIGQRTSALFSPYHLGITHDRYLGNAVGGSLRAEATPGLPSVTGSLTWYPLEGLGIEIGIDVLRLQLIGSLKINGDILE